MSVYRPSLFRFEKYSKYFLYFIESFKRKDFQSIIDSFKYVAFQKLPKKERRVTTKMGNFLLRPQTTDFQFVNMTYEQKIKKFIEDNIESIGSFIDIGACIGEYCIWIAQKGIKTMAIEPVNFKAINRNIIINQLDPEKIIVVPCAAGEYETMGDFNVEFEVTGSSYMTLEREGTGDTRIRPLDNILTDLHFKPSVTKYTLIKIDVEGYEIKALKGAKNLIKNVKNLAIIYEHTTCTEKAIQETLNQMGNFEYTYLDDVNTLAIKRQK